MDAAKVMGKQVGAADEMPDSKIATVSFMFGPHDSPSELRMLTQDGGATYTVAVACFNQDWKSNNKALAGAPLNAEVERMTQACTAQAQHTSAYMEVQVVDHSTHLTF